MLKVSFDVIISKRLKELLRDAVKPIDKATATSAAEATIDAMKATIARGVSPIRGNGRFPKYKDPKKYPGKLKPKTPVNLHLTGDMLDALTFKAVPDSAGYAAEIFYKGKQELKELGHRDGANDQPKRPTLPVGDKESFTKQIKDRYVKIFADRIFDVIKGRG